MGVSKLEAPPAQFDLPALERAIIDLWAKNGTEDRSLRRGAESARQAGRAAFVFYDGPPFATGLPHYGHLLAGTIKDIVPRYQTMLGLAVERRFGWDCHGLPIESITEEELGVHGRAEIEALGVDKFNAACRAGVLRYTQEWEQTVRRLGRWIDFRNDYKTMDATFMESVWWVFRRLWDEGLIYEGYRVQPVDPSLGTPLSNFEVAQGPQEKDPVTRKEGHKRRQDPSLTVRFRLEDEDAFLWAWTTTPWTLPSNLALAVHPELEYVKVRVVETGEIAYVEPGRLADYQARGKVGATEELARMPGASLVGRPYAPLFAYFADFKTRDDGSRGAFRVVGADYVTTSSGTGIVHQAPAFGEDDFQVGQREKLPVIVPVDLQGRFTAAVIDFAGQSVKEADKGIVQRLKAEGKVVDQDVIVHPYPHSYRTDEPLLYMALSTWFMKVESIRERLVEHNASIHWVPEHVGSGRFGNWLALARDWNLARNRYWGTPLPIWRCDADPSDMVCVGSVAELEKLAGLESGSITDLHRESIDDITFASAKTPGGTMRRVAEVFDCWFESGSMPYAQNHYPFATEKKAYVEDNLPADFIAEGLDQTRGWFYTLHVLATALFDRPAFKNVIVNGLILAEDGKKMSKRLKNYPEPSKVIEEYGADALRAYLINSAVVKAEPMRFSEQGVRDTVRTVVLPLWNAYRFLTTYAVADGWSPTDADLRGTFRPENALDRWMLNKLQGFISEVRGELDGYALSNVMPAFTRLCDDLNNWYIRRGRRRYWKARDEGDSRDKRDAYATLYRSLVTVARAIAPVMPFFGEWLYQRLVVDPGLAGEVDSVHFDRYPEADASLRDLALERDIEVVRRAVALGLAVRERVAVAVRRPLGTLTIAVADADARSALKRYREELLGELNMKQLELREDDAALVRLGAKANFKLLGKRLGKRMKDVASAVATLTPEAIASFVTQGWIELAGERLEGEEIFIEREALGGKAAEAAHGLTVAIDPEPTPELHREGLARELVNRIQSLRKQADLDVSDRIRVRLACEGELAQVARDAELGDLLRSETLASELEVLGPSEADGADGSLGAHVAPPSTIDGASIRVGLTKL